MVMPYHLHMPSYFLETFTEYPYREKQKGRNKKSALFSFYYFSNWISGNVRIHSCFHHYNHHRIHLRSHHNHSRILLHSSFLPFPEFLH